MVNTSELNERSGQTCSEESRIEGAADILITHESRMRTPARLSHPNPGLDAGIFGQKGWPLSKSRGKNPKVCF